MAARHNNIDSLRHELLELHRALIDTQRIHHERTHGRVETSNQFLGLVLNHPDFEWIRALSALIAQMDDWAEARDTASDQELAGLLDTLHDLLHPEGGNRAFRDRYWAMVQDDPEVTVAHVKVWRLLEAIPARSATPGRRPSHPPTGSP